VPSPAALGIARWSLHQIESNPSSSAIRATASIVLRSASVSCTFGTVTPMRMAGEGYACTGARASAVASACSISSRPAGPRERQAITPSGRTSVAPPADSP
jgi:hypothetical protein